jgi:hypothetical protein
MLAQLVADGCADQIATIGIKPLLHQQVDLAQIDGAEVDGDLFRLGGAFLEFLSGHDLHPITIYMDGSIGLKRCIASTNAHECGT